jgi:hypothetical protein
MIPAEVLLIPSSASLQDGIAGIVWANSFRAVMIPRASEAVGVFLTRYPLSVPDELLEAAPRRRRRARHRARPHQTALSACAAAGAGPRRALRCCRTALV